MATPRATLREAGECALYAGVCTIGIAAFTLESVLTWRHGRSEHLQEAGYTAGAIGSLCLAGALTIKSVQLVGKALQQAFIAGQESVRQEQPNDGGNDAASES